MVLTQRSIGECRCCVVCMCDLYSDATPPLSGYHCGRRYDHCRRLCWSIQALGREMDQAGRTEILEAFMHRINGFLCYYVHCVAARWFDSVPANHMDAQSKEVTLLVQ